MKSARTLLLLNSAVWAINGLPPARRQTVFEQVARLFKDGQFAPVEPTSKPYICVAQVHSPSGVGSDGPKELGIAFSCRSDEFIIIAVGTVGELSLSMLLTDLAVLEYIDPRCVGLRMLAHLDNEHATDRLRSLTEFYVRRSSNAP